jgi:hypothetical protein
MMDWTVEQVIDYFDSHWNCTLTQLARLSGWTVAELKGVLLS